MTRLRISDLSPNMKTQLLKKLTEEERRELFSGKDEKKSKYKAQKSTAILKDGTEHTFDSKKEAKVYSELSIREQAGEIKNLQIQVPYELIPSQKLSNGKTERSVRYVADFVYEEDGVTKVVDVKGYRQGGAYSVFVIKRKLMKWVHGIEVEEI